MEKLFICLANSKKYNERCIAGIELEQSLRKEVGLHGINIVRTKDGNPKWIRPVSATQSGAVSADLVNHVRLLDVLKLNVTAPTPQGYQSENVYFDGGSLEVIDNIQGTPSSIERLLSGRKGLLFGNSLNAVSVEDIVSLNHSLELIKPENPRVYQKTYVDRESQIRARFILNGYAYDLPITDIDFEDCFRNNPTILDSCAHIYFTISLAGKFRGRHFKLIAGVVYW